MHCKIRCTLNFRKSYFLMKTTGDQTLLMPYFQLLLNYLPSLIKTAVIQLVGSSIL